MEKDRRSWRFLERLKGLPLRYRLIIPFILLALFGTSSLVWISILSQNTLIRQQEEQRLDGLLHTFSQALDLRSRWAVSLAAGFAKNPELARALAQRDRLRLLALYYESYLFMERQYGVKQFHFQVTPGRSFLRLHRLYQYGDDVRATRKQVRDALSQGKAVYGLERGATGYGIRGVAPVSWKGSVVGTVDIGFALSDEILQNLHLRPDERISLLMPAGSENGHLTFRSVATNLDQPFLRTDPVYENVFQTGRNAHIHRMLAGHPFCVLLSVIRDYGGRPAALVELGVDRWQTLQQTTRYRRWMIGLGLVGMVLSIGAIYLISYLFTRPIDRMIELAREIGQGHQVRPLDVRPSGELGTLADALADMLRSLEMSREQIKLYAATLEEKVQARTRELRESEEKYRSLVERVPLVVYRVDVTGRTVYVNHFVEDLLGVSPPEILGDTWFWKEKVWEEDRERIWPLMDRCLNEGREYREEYRVRHREARAVHVLDHAIPVLGDDGRVQMVDGFLVDVSERYELQQQIIQTEELKTLSEISARLAHEIRNPIAVAGGFARRLLNRLPQGDANRRKAEIILEEMARLEGILEKVLAYLRPVEVSLQKGDINGLIEEVLKESESGHFQKSIRTTVSLQPDLPPLMLDPAWMKRSLTVLLAALVSYCPAEGGLLQIHTHGLPASVLVEIKACGLHLSDDDIEHFFYPFTSRLDETRQLDLPLAKMILHKHGGLVRLQRTGERELLLTITLPVC
ncbi:PAS domain S-box-containing protein [Desulfacinum hydrothermale DSM 13146]|uniref:histidine kinase n=1 Tax=Desulfacinum hydrothermale DSM 13146 TaxID=1121390 RepID=A0A1W1X6K8_9BACT|nr:cache domain-containing protein [Desulfacinum hydrothermale]SMC19599.1 PAS domain S-box-containing protein [Desulfacinum hydrothermale DSM 13146]